MATAEQILDVARSQIGYREGQGGANKYGAAYGMDRVAWCAEFVWWCFRQAGADALIMQRTAYTPTLANWYRQRGRFDAAPQVGDLVFYNWPDSTDRIQHVGIVEAVEPTAVVTIEGNTTSGMAGDQSNGGGVWRRRRARNTSIVGYGHPAYAAANKASGGDWFDMATRDDLAAVVNAVIDARLGRTIFETTGRIDNRRGPGGANIKNGGNESLFGYAANADGFGFRIEKLLTEVAARVGAGSSAPPALTPADRTAIATEVANLLAARLTP